MKPNKFSKITQQSLTLVGQIVLIVIALSTIFAVFQEIGHIWEAGSIAVGDLLMLFLYLEVMSMLNHYLGSGNLPVRYPYVYWYYCTSAFSSFRYSRHRCF
jgi:protein PsiE